MGGKGRTAVRQPRRSDEMHVCALSVGLAWYGVVMSSIDSGDGLRCRASGGTAELCRGAIREGDF